MDKQPILTGIKTIPPGQQVVTFCVVRNNEIKLKQNGEPYLVLELGDKSGRLKARIWENPREMSALASKGSIVKIKAIVQKYKDIRELKILKLRKATPKDGISLSDLLPVTKKDVTLLKTQFNNHRSSIENKFLVKLLNDLFADQSFTEAYFSSPAGKLWHHNYLSGLLEHVVSLLDMADVLKKHYPEINLDLLKTGIICHDVGKVSEYSFNGYIDFSDEGRLLGYITMGYEMLTRKIDQIDQFPGELKKQLLHLILSHSPPTSTGAPIKPMTLEALILQQLIQLDAYANAVCRIQESDILPGEKWSKYIPLLDRFIYAASPTRVSNQDD